MKESIDVILRQKQLIEDQIKELNIFEVVVEDCIIQVHFSLLLTLIDGKVLNAIITNTKSSQSCPICHATPKYFNDLSNKDKGTFLADPRSLQHGKLVHFMRGLDFLNAVFIYLTGSPLINGRYDQ